MNNTSGITAVYINMLKNILYFLTACSAVLSAGIIIVFPVWFFAVKYPSAYSLAIVLVLISAVIITTSLKLYRKELSIKSIIVFIIKLFYFLVLICGAGAVVVLYMNNLIFQGSVIMTVLFIVSGFIAWIKKKV